MEGMPEVNLVGCIKDDMKSFGLSHDEAQDKDDWRMKIKGTTI